MSYLRRKRPWSLAAMIWRRVEELPGPGSWYRNVRLPFGASGQSVLSEGSAGLKAFDRTTRASFGVREQRKSLELSPNRLQVGFLEHLWSSDLGVNQAVSEGS